MLAGTDDHLTWLSPVILNLENMGLTHLESEIRVTPYPFQASFCRTGLPKTQEIKQKYHSIDDNCYLKNVC